MKRVALVVHPKQPDALEAADKLAHLSEERGVEVTWDTDSDADAIIALGGDGTILRAADVAFRMDVPLIGINLGNLGFLSTAEVSDLVEAFDSLVAGRFEIEERMMLEARATDPKGGSLQVIALNEVVVERASLSHVVAIRLSVDGQRVATYTADGFIVATPTGSTAYSLSAGGPVVEPGLQALVLTSVSAHSPLWRAIVVAPDRKVRLEIPSDEVGLSADGRPVGKLVPGTVVEVTASNRPLKLVRFEGPRFYEKLRSRFHVETDL